MMGFFKFSIAREWRSRASWEGGDLLFIGLNKNGVRLELLDELLGPLSKHRRLVHGTDEVNFLAIEALSQMDQSCLEAVLSIWIVISHHHKIFIPIKWSYLPIAHPIIGGSVEVGGTDEHMTRECGPVVGSDHALIYGLVPVHSVCHFVLLTLSN